MSKRNPNSKPPSAAPAGVSKAALVRRANEAANRLSGTARIVASSPWRRRGNQLSRRVLSMHSPDRDALLFSMQTIDLGDGPDKVKTKRILKVSMSEANFPDWAEEVLNGDRGPSFHKFINRCFAMLENGDNDAAHLLFDFLTRYNEQELENEGDLMEFTTEELDADVYGIDFEVRYEFTVTPDGYTSLAIQDGIADSGPIGSLDDLLKDRVGSDPERELAEHFQAFYEDLPDSAPLKRRQLLEGVSARDVPAAEPRQPPSESSA